jgi:hypothetical protein
MESVRDLLKGFVDVHIHAGPSLMVRELDAWDMAVEAAKGEFAAIVIKDHHLPSVGATRIIQDHLGDSTLKVFGSMALNSSVGGLNPKAVEVAIGFGAKVIWMPTVSCKNHIEKHTGHGLKFPSVKQKLAVPEEPLVCIEEGGNLISEAVQVLEVVGQHPEVVLATGHGSREEIDAIVRNASTIGVKRVLVDHPHYMVDATLDDMKSWQSLGAYIEFTAVVSVPSSQFYCKPVASVAELIKNLSNEKLVLSSDYGQAGNGSPVDGMCAFLELLLQEGIEERDLRQMLTENPANLLGL